MDSDSDSDSDSDVDTDTWPNGDTAPEGYGDLSEICWIRTFSSDPGECEGLGFQGLMVLDALAFENGSSAIAGTYRGPVVFGQGEPNETQLSPTSPNDCGVHDHFIAWFDSEGNLERVIRTGAVNPDWTKGIAIDKTGDEGVVVLGTFAGTALFGEGEANETLLDSGGGGALFLARYDAIGDLVWARKDGDGPMVSEGGLTVLPDDSVIVFGRSNDDIVFGEGEIHETEFEVTEPTGFIVRYYNTGDMAWAIEANGALSVRDFGVDPEGLFLIPTVDYGFWDDPHATNYDYMGNEQWDYAMSGENIHFSSSVVLSDATHLLVGTLGANLTLTVDADDVVLTVPCVDEDTQTDCWDSVFTAQLSPAGECLWAASTQHGIGSWARAAAAAAGSGGFLVTGIIYGAVQFGDGEPADSWLVSSGDLEPFVARYDNDGDLAWVNRVGSSWSDDSGSSATVDLGDGTFLLAGWLRGTVELLVGEDEYVSVSAQGDSSGFLLRSCP